VVVWLFLVLDAFRAGDVFSSALHCFMYSQIPMFILVNPFFFFFGSSGV
jgi:hypothetical protein